uniref:Protein BFR2 n=1 Tax=Percolomonas cosmopolitus TaxID=63605 RepID=A0A7S1KUN4_9EUKA|mmetsp:Transcript_9272/g.34307  ORF Transcript_9272/g.34307 Transcript_9272/m.34307 type:complete len:472 (+) Transcript_9272:3-1418(+)
MSRSKSLSAPLPSHSDSSSQSDSDFENESFRQVARLDKNVEIHDSGDIVLLKAGQKRRNGSSAAAAAKEALPLRSKQWDKDFSEGKYEGSVVEQAQVFSDPKKQTNGSDEENHHEMELEINLHEEDDQDLEKIRTQLASNDNLLLDEDDLMGSLAEKRRAEIRKAQHAHRQKILWDNILRLRISLQKPLDIVNRLPVPVSAETKSDERLGQQLRSTMHQLLSLQNSLLDAYTTRTVARKQSYRGAAENIEEFDESHLDILHSIGSNEEMEENLDSIWNLVKHSYQRWKILREKSINSWHRKTQQVAGGGTSTTSTLKSINADATQQVNRQLRQMKKLIRETQVPRFSGPVLGKRKRITDKENNRQLDTEIFDDRDFYQSLLSNLIQESSAQSSRVQDKNGQPPHKKQKHSRPKTKDKTLKYVTVTELVGFMAPEPRTIPQATRALFNGLFGKKRCEDRVNVFEYMSDEDSS